MKNKYAAKQFVASHHMKEEKKFWNRIIAVSAIGLVLVGFGIAAYFDALNYDLVKQVEAGR